MRVVGGYNPVRSPQPGTKGTLNPQAIVQYPGTNTKAVRGGYQIWPQGYDVKIEVDARGAIHLAVPENFKPAERMPLPHDRVVASMTPLSALAAPAREIELV